MLGETAVPPVTTNAHGSVSLKPNGHAFDFTLDVYWLTAADSVRVYIGRPRELGVARMELCSPCNFGSAVPAHVTGTVAVHAEFPPESLLAAMREFRAFVQIVTDSGPVLRGALTGFRGTPSF
jgi:hypothetical protein